MENTDLANKKGEIAIIGGGPAALLLLKALVDENLKALSIHIFEASDRLGMGMPYSPYGALKEHITNVSGDEIPKFKESLIEWVASRSDDYLRYFQINKNDFHEKEPVPRLLFGHYLSDQFTLYLEEALLQDHQIFLHANTGVKDVKYHAAQEKVEIIDLDEKSILVDYAVICTGHSWPKKIEGTVPGYFDSPYPPHKLQLKVNHRVAIKGASLTAVDAIRTLARVNGSFLHDSAGKFVYRLDDASSGFAIQLHALNGLLPAVRIHLQDPRLGKGKVLGDREIETLRAKNDGFLPLDEVYARAFLQPLKEQDPIFYSSIAQLSMEEFVEKMLRYREEMDPFSLMEKELSQAEETFKKRDTVAWKEMLSVLSFIMNYPAKYFSAEDMLRLQRVLKPLISVVIAFLPQCSAVELLALKDAGVLSLKEVTAESSVLPLATGGVIYHYSEQEEESFPLYIDCTGQSAMQIQDFPFSSLKDAGEIVQAQLAFRDVLKAREESQQGNKEVCFEKGTGYLNVPGIAINDSFQLLNVYAQYNKCLYIMAVPYIGGYNPDYSGLDFCEEAAHRVAKGLKSDILARCL